MFIVNEKNIFITLYTLFENVLFSSYNEKKIVVFQIMRVGNLYKYYKTNLL